MGTQGATASRNKLQAQCIRNEHPCASNENVSSKTEFTASFHCLHIKPAESAWESQDATSNIPRTKFKIAQISRSRSLNLFGWLSNNPDTDDPERWLDKMISVVLRKSA